MHTKIRREILRGEICFAGKGREGGKENLERFSFYIYLVIEVGKNCFNWLEKEPEVENPAYGNKSLTLLFSFLKNIAQKNPFTFYFMTSDHLFFFFFCLLSHSSLRSQPLSLLATPRGPLFFYFSHTSSSTLCIYMYSTVQYRVLYLLTILYTKLQQSPK